MKTIVVTGHSKGIGQAVTKQLIENGDHVIGIARSAAPQQDSLTQYEADLSDVAETAAVAKEIAKTKTLNAIVCNAGSGTFAALENFSVNQIQQQLQLNLLSPLILLRSILPILKRQESSHVVLVGSESAIKGGKFGSVYSAAKFGIRGAAQALRHECASANCKVGIINPGMTRSDFFDDLAFEPGSQDSHALLANDVAKAVLIMLNSSGSAVIDEIVINPLHHVVRKK